MSPSSSPSASTVTGATATSGCASGALRPSSSVSRWRSGSPPRARRVTSPDAFVTNKPDEGDEEPPRYVRIGNAVLAIAEDVIYVGIAVLLAVAAGMLLVSAAAGLTDIGGDQSASEVVLASLDTLLLDFIVV